MAFVGERLRPYTLLVPRSMTLRRRWIIANGFWPSSTITEIDCKIRPAGKTTFIKHLIGAPLERP